MEVIVFTGWARREVLLLNYCPPLDFQKPRKVFLMPYTDISKGIAHTNYFLSYNDWGLLCARCYTEQTVHALKILPAEKELVETGETPSTATVGWLCCCSYSGWARHMTVLPQRYIPLQTCPPMLTELADGARRGIITPEWLWMEDGIPVLPWNWRGFLGSLSFFFPASERLRFG